MKVYILSVLFLMLATVTLKAHASENYAMSVISREASISKEAIRLYNLQLKRADSLLSQKLGSLRDSVVEATAEDLVLVKSGKLAGADFSTYLLAVNVANASGLSTIGHISVLYYSDLSEEEIGLSTRIYLNGFVDDLVK
jgi:hypothetical protein